MDKSKYCIKTETDVQYSYIGKRKSTIYLYEYILRIDDIDFLLQENCRQRICLKV